MDWMSHELSSSEVIAVRNAAITDNRCLDCAYEREHDNSAEGHT